MADPTLTLLYDGACPLCRREVEVLQRQDLRRHGAERSRLRFVDIADPSYDPAAHAGITYREAMGRMHGIRGDGTVLRDVAVFREAYRLVDLGWLYAPTGWPLIAPLVDVLYGLWARWRLRITGRPDLDTLCCGREGCSGTAPAVARLPGVTLGRGFLGRAIGTPAGAETTGAPDRR